MDFKLSHEKAKEGFLASFQYIEFTMKILYHLKIAPRKKNKNKRGSNDM